jgi:hypothetical protein
MFEPILQQFGRPRAETASTIERLGLAHSGTLKQFVVEIGGGIFADGLFSVLSVREQVDDLGEWQDWLPPDARLFACSAFGFLFLTRGDDVWLVDTQYGEILEADCSLEEAILQFTQLTTQEEILRSSLFQIWNEMIGLLPSNSVLCPIPAIALGGTWTATTLSVMTLPIYLSFTGQIFTRDGGMPAQVHRLEE